MVISQCKWEDNNCLLKRRISSLASALKRLRKRRVQIGSSLNSRALWGRAKEARWGRQLRLCYFSPLLSFLNAGGPQLIFESRAGGRKTGRARGHQFWIKKKKKNPQQSLICLCTCPRVWQLRNHKLNWQLRPIDKHCCSQFIKPRLYSCGAIFVPCCRKSKMFQQNKQITCGRSSYFLKPTDSLKYSKVVSSQGWNWVKHQLTSCILPPVYSKPSRAQCTYCVVHWYRHR